MRRMRSILILMVTSGTLVVAQELTIDWFTTDGGGAMFTTGGDFELSGTIGQPDANPIVLTGGDFELVGGFWGVASTPGVPCPGDVDGDGVVGLGDLSILLENFGTIGGATPEMGDINGDGNVDLSDLSLLLEAYGTTCG